jgi:glucose-1-phosphate thymidylyltransferase
VIWAKEVEDYQRFGVIVTDDDGNMKRIVEKPTDPISKLANIGLYYIRDWQLLFEGIAVDGGPPGKAGEYYLTDAFQYMIDRGAKIRVEEVGGWYDCGQLETLLETNRHLLEMMW